MAAVAEVVEGDSEHLEIKLTLGAVDLSLCIGSAASEIPLQAGRHFAVTRHRNEVHAVEGA